MIVPSAASASAPAAPHGAHRELPHRGAVAGRASQHQQPDSRVQGGIVGPKPDQKGDCQRKRVARGEPQQEWLGTVRCKRRVIEIGILFIPHLETIGLK